MAEQTDLVARALALRDTAARWRLSMASARGKKLDGTTIPSIDKKGAEFTVQDARLYLYHGEFGDSNVTGHSVTAAQSRDVVESKVLREVLHEMGWVIAERMADRLDAMARSAMQDAEAQAREVIAAIDAENEPPF